MGYALGVDLGTTYTAAATYMDGRVEIASLGNRSAAIPSVVLLREDEEILTGEAASRRGASEPGRVAREFKRRVGDTTPLFLGGAPYSAEQLMARLLGWVTAEVAKLQGTGADHLAISHPANWGSYKKDLLAQAVRMADLPQADFLTEPEAAAIHYASQSRVEVGEVIAVYDLGGGTFDAAVLRKTADGFEILGEPEGVERLGGIDFDAAVFAHVARSLDGKLEELDEDDPTAIAAVARLRQECVDAKEALSTDTDASIPVLLPNVQTEVRLTRSEFESMVRPALGESIAAMRRALASAEVEPESVSTVLLVGGSSRIPLVAQMVGAELGRPVAVDAHPKHAIALGAALAAAQAGGMSGAGGTVKEDAGSDSAAGAAAAGAGVGAAAGAVVGAAAASEVLTGAEAGQPDAPAATPPAPAPSAPAAAAAGGAAAGAAAGTAAAASAGEPPTYPAPTDPTAVTPTATPPPAPAAPTASVPAQPAPAAAAGAAGDPPGGGTSDDGKSGGVPSWAIYGGILVIVLLVAGVAFLLTGGDDSGDSSQAATETTTATGSTESSGSTDDTAPATTAAPAAAGSVETVPCDSSGGLEACIEGVTVDEASNTFVGRLHHRLHRRSQLRGRVEPLPLLPESADGAGPGRQQRGVTRQLVCLRRRLARGGRRFGADAGGRGGQRLDRALCRRGLRVPHVRARHGQLCLARGCDVLIIRSHPESDRRAIQAAEIEGRRAREVDTVGS